MKPQYPVLHIFMQASWHTEAHIIGNRAGLLELRKVIDAALQVPAPEEGEASQKDGECFDFHVRCVKESWVQAIPDAYSEAPDDWDNPEVRKAFDSILSGLGFDSGKEKEE